MTDFWVGNFRVDVSRAQIIAKDSIISLEPRVLKVLLTLAKTPGEVVTHEALLESVWPNVVVAPNAVQRCIGQLRKALGDDAKQQKMIATYPKVGYSLIAKVENVVPSTKKQMYEADADAIKPQKIQWLIGLVLVCLLGLIFTFLKDEKTSQSFNSLSPITSTDKKEFYPSFSPDGRYLVFNRFVDVCENELWAKDLQENKEYKLTQQAGFYGYTSWSPDGNQLAFSNKVGCGAKNFCHNISAVSFLLAKTKPQSPRELLDCSASNHYSNINWLSENKLVYIDHYAHQAEVKILDIEHGLSNIIYEDEKQTPQMLSYSNRNNNLAITLHDSMQNTSLVLLNMIDKSKVYVPLKIPSQYSDISLWPLSWHPFKDTFLTSVDSSLFEIDLNGTFSEFPIPTVSNIYHPVYHPNGNKIVAVMGDVDLDIKEYLLPIQNNDKNESAMILDNKFNLNSTVEDYQAKYQPKTEFLSFVSARSGQEEIWLSKNNGVKQLSNFRENTRIKSYVWALDGQSLILVIDGKLHLLTLDGQSQEISTTFKVINVYQWVDRSKVLLSVIEQESTVPTVNNRKVILLDIDTGKYEDIYQGFSSWAQLDDEFGFYYTDRNQKLYHYHNNKAQLFSATEGVVFSSGFILKENKLMHLNQNRIWLYDIESQSMSTMKIPKSSEKIAHINDIELSRNKVLFSVFKSFRKDLVMFHIE